MKSIMLTVRFMDTNDPVELQAMFTSHNQQLTTACWIAGGILPESDPESRGMYPVELKLLSQFIQAIKATDNYPAIRRKKVQNDDGTWHWISDLTYPSEFPAK